MKDETTKPAFVIPPRPACIPPRPQPPQAAAGGAAPQGRLQPTASADGEAPQGLPVRLPGARAVKRKRAKPFEDLEAHEIVQDAESKDALRPECAQFHYTGLGGAYFVPVSFAAKDWKVSSRRIRALLAAGRLAGRLQENGYWEVRFPYLFAMGTRGPALKRHCKPERRAA